MTLASGVVRHFSSGTPQLVCDLNVTWASDKEMTDDLKILLGKETSDDQLRKKWGTATESTLRFSVETHVLQCVDTAAECETQMQFSNRSRECR